MSILIFFSHSCILNCNLNRIWVKVLQYTVSAGLWVLEFYQCTKACVRQLAGYQPSGGVRFYNLCT